MKQKRLSVGVGAFLFLYTWLFHAYMMFVLPDPIFDIDTGDYLRGALVKLSGGCFSVPAYRGLGYPLFLWVSLRSLGNFHNVLWLQHALWITMALLTAALFLKYRPKNLWGAMFLFLIVACSPRGTVLSHAILPDTSFAFWQIVSLGSLLGLFSAEPVINGIIGGGALCMALNTRPVGKTIVLAALILALSRKMTAETRRTAVCVLLGFAVTLIPFLSFNRLVRGFWGIEDFSALYLSGVGIRNLEPADIQDAELRKVLTPFYLPGARERFNDTVWIRCAPDGPVTAIQNDPALGPHCNDWLRRLTRRALFKHPLACTEDILNTCIQFIWRGTEAPKSVVNKALTIKRGLISYYQMTETMPALQSLLRFKPGWASAYFARIDRIPLVPFDSKPRFFFPLWCLSRIYGLLSPLGVLSLLWLIFRSWDSSLVKVCACIIFGEILLVGTGGCYVYRFAVPLEPLYALMIFLAASGRVSETSGRMRHSDE